MAHERWVKMVTMAARESGLLDIDEVVTLLARQHRAFARMVKRLPTCNNMGVWIAKKDILAALAKQGGKK